MRCWHIYHGDVHVGTIPSASETRMTPNRRLIAADHTGVTFRWKNYRIEGPGRYQTMTLPTHESSSDAS